MTTKEVLAWLEKTGTKAARDGMARYGIVASHACGVPMGALLKKSKEIGTDQRLSLALWDTGCYEARLLAALVGDPAQVTRAQMKSWGDGFENWADGDTACFKLLDRSPLAWEFVGIWANSPREYTKRGAFALLASLALHDRKTSDSTFMRMLPVVEAAAVDERNFVVKGVSWALRSIGRRSPALASACLTLASRLSSSKAATTRWIGNDVSRELSKLAGKKTPARSAPSAKSSAATGNSATKAAPRKTRARRPATTKATRR